MRYGLLVAPGAKRELGSIPQNLYPAIRDAISALRTNQRPPGNQKLRDRPGYRVRVGDYRIIYDIDDAQQTVTIRRVAHRREIYRG